ncbi:MAG: glycerate kinase, partial [Actinobacteria bacterium]|nr:glycerate kinase [Actinomycetota bacterium]
MRIVVAPDKFAGTLSAVEAAEAIKAGWNSYAPQDHVEVLPLADGGPGFVAVLERALGGQLLDVQTTGPAGQSVVAQILIHDETAYIESAQACGLHLMPQLAALEATSEGVADLLVAAVAAGVRHIVVGVGGTACTDGGEPMLTRLQQLTGKALSDFDIVVGVGGTACTDGGEPMLTRLQQLTGKALSDFDIDVVVATDVDNPLLGVHGAAAVFGAQKGATDADVAVLEQRLTQWSQRAGGDAMQVGAGAGGGLGFALFRLGGRRVSGIDTCVDAIRFDSAVANADLVLTGEGSFDYQSLR